MNFYTVLDVSSIIWDKELFSNDQHNHFKLLDNLSELLLTLENEDVCILLRKELHHDLVFNSFPWENIQNDFGL